MKTLDIDKFHLVEGDTDSLYFAVSGNLNGPINQSFNHIIKDTKYWDDHVFDYLPYNTICFDESKRPKLETPEDKIKHEKKLLGFATEGQAESAIALCPKCYTLFNNDDKQLKRKFKGVSARQNPQVNLQAYIDCILYSESVNGTNSILQMKNGKMSSVTINKVALSARMNKMRVHENGSCYPLIDGVKYA